MPNKSPALGHCFMPMDHHSSFRIKNLIIGTAAHPEGYMFSVYHKWWGLCYQEDNRWSSTKTLFWVWFLKLLLLLTDGVHLCSLKITLRKIYVQQLLGSDININTSRQRKQVELCRERCFTVIWRRDGFLE